MPSYSFDSKNQAHKLGELGGCIKTLLSSARIEFVIVPPKTLKKFVTGNGNATKEDMKAHYGLKDHNQADAMGLAEFGLHYLGAMKPKTRYQKTCRKCDARGGKRVYK